MCVRAPIVGDYTGVKFSAPKIWNKCATGWVAEESDFQVISKIAPKAMIIFRSVIE